MIIGYDPAKIAEHYIPNWSIKTMNNDNNINMCKHSSIGEDDCCMNCNMHVPQLAAFKRTQASRIAERKSLFVIDSKYGTCSKCLTKVEVAYWGDHVCILDADKVDASPIQEDHNYGSVLDEDKFDIGAMSKFNDHFDTSKSIGDILGDAITNQEQSNFKDALVRQSILTGQDRFIASLYECVASHYENGDRIGAEAILNAIQYAQEP